ncbi:response regulator transcription factor [Rhodocytophaga rosea]|uniref:Response regulator transcription factor n=1 Tax=Rhodocytophaga rosea TaxID=2704465 RepID=A0A6C0GBW4_9BACT|nr:response regulator transcription factor [Rhodocytophaga rosea]QHT65240.1 response regulator transcription factor [Rhodocytophaga rosea]
MTVKKNIRVSIVEYNKTRREGLALLVNSTFGYCVINAYENCKILLHRLPTEYPDVVLAAWQSFNGYTFDSACIKCISQIKQMAPYTKVIIFNGIDYQKVIFQTLKAGADGYLIQFTSPAKLLESIKEVYEGGAPLSPVIARAIVASFHKNISSTLSPREVQVLELLAKCKTYAVIAEDLFIDRETARSHIKNIYWKLEVHSKAAAIEKALSEKII